MGERQLTTAQRRMLRNINSAHFGIDLNRLRATTSNVLLTRGFIEKAQCIGGGPIFFIVTDAGRAALASGARPDE